jgi:hypothetical protein
MNLTSAQIGLIRDSFHLLEPDAEIAEKFYDRLFEIARSFGRCFAAT